MTDLENVLRIKKEKITGALGCGDCHKAVIARENLYCKSHMEEIKKLYNVVC